MLSLFGYTVGETSKMTINTAANVSTLHHCAAVPAVHSRVAGSSMGGSMAAAWVHSVRLSIHLLQWNAVRPVIANKC